MIKEDECVTDYIQSVRDEYEKAAKSIYSYLVSFMEADEKGEGENVLRSFRNMYAKELKTLGIP